MPKERQHWIDSMRGMCMAAILLDHTEIYYTGSNIINYNMYVTDALYLFFFISGYLLYKKNMKVCIRKKLDSILMKLVMPYFIFTTIMAIPKAMAHGNVINFYDIFINIVTGQASWFVAALAVSEFFFITALRICREKTLPLTMVCILALLAAAMLANIRPSYFWQIDNALLAMPLLLLGYMYHKYEYGILYSVPILVFATLLLVAVKTYVANNGVNLVIWHIDISNYLVFVINVIAGSLTITSIFKRLPKCKWLEWIGRHTIVYYFLCGGIPLVVCGMFNRFGVTYQDNYLTIIVVYATVCLLSTFLVALIYKYIPFVTGRY